VLAAATRPRYGGTLRMEMRERMATVEPSARIGSLIFDRLIRFDDNGKPQPALALSWQSDAAQKRWEFRLRPGVKFHDGYPLTAAAVSGALQRLMGPGTSVAVSGESVVVQSERPLPGLLADLARPPASIAARGTDGALVGTGPFRVARFEADHRLSLAAFEEHWSGRPFVDTVEIEMGRSTRDQLIDLQVGRADIVELGPSSYNAANKWTSSPVELIALVFGQDTRLREAIAICIDRGAMNTVLLQRQGVVTGALLPQWLSGWAFLFPAGRDLARARQLAAEVPPAERTLPLSYDASDARARILAERIAVNARDAGITLQVTSQPRSELRLARARFSSFDTARALEELAAGLGLGEVRGGSYAAERAALEGFRVVPLFHLPDAYGIGPKVKLWTKAGVSRIGILQLADVWLEAAP
jgi:ABC-type transport system substrate-binding protein